ncbi:gag/pol protein [Gossypium australe]|uniref:Gag/pol protein n=1 Tax=Gossypium australe TaxID=47621 RepID=A0A5B6V4G4_9ROSI|nr:gag/pol protein [Gossypium australe]
MQPVRYIAKGNEHKVCKLLRSIYGLKQASFSWNQRFDQVIKTFGFEQNNDEPCAYKCLGDGNENLGEANFVLGIRILRNRKSKVIALSKTSYIDKILEHYAMTNSKKGNQPFVSGYHLSLEDCPKTVKERENMRKVPYVSVVESLMYAMHTPRYLFCSGAEREIICLCIPKETLLPIEYTDSDFQTYHDLRKSTSSYVFFLSDGSIVWRSVKQTCTPDSTMKVEYVAASEATKEAIWLRKFLRDLEVIPDMEKAITLYCDCSATITNTKEARNHKRTKHIDQKYHIIKEVVADGIVDVVKVTSEDNLADLFTNTILARSFEEHMESMGMQNMAYLFQ